MGNYRFRLSDMMPNAWFYKLKNGAAAQPLKNNNKHKNIQHHHHYLITPTPTPPCRHQTPPPPQISHPRHSYYFTREPYTKSIIAATEPPRKSWKRSRPKTRRRTANKQSVSSVPYSCDFRQQSSPSSTASKSDSTPAGASPELLDSQGVDTNSSSVIDMTDSKKFPSADGFDPITEMELPRIITKAHTKFSRNKTKEEKSGRRISASKDVGGWSLSSKERKSSPCVRTSVSVGSPGLKLRSNSPRILTRKVHSKDMAMAFLGAKPIKQRTTTAPATAGTATTVSSMNKNVSDSFAIMKCSYDPQRDFRESMVEMIVENDLRKSGDLEELLACYLSLNSNEYHDMIVKVFERIWFDLTDNH